MKSILPIFFSLLLSSLFAQDNVTILHTNDLHSYFKGSLVSKNGETYKLGGHSYLAKKVKDLKAELEEEGEDVLLFDAGDFYSGTLFHSLALDPLLPFFPEYEFFNYLKYDGVTLGNHEFDGGDKGFSLLMKKVNSLGNKVSIISSNFVNEKDFPIEKSKIITLSKGRKIGVIGALGPDGCSVSSGSRQNLHFIGYQDDKSKNKWRDLEDLLDREAKKLKDKGASSVILLFHGGTGEDDRLAKNLKHVNVIIAGHTHEIYQKVVKNKVISQAGSYAEALGVLPLNINKHGTTLRAPIRGSYHHLISKDDEPDTSYQETISFYERSLKKIKKNNDFPEISFQNTEYKSRKQVGRDFTQRIKEGLEKEESELSLYFSTLGLIRKPMYANHSYTTEDIFNILPIGFHDGFKLGYPVVSFYLSYSDLKQLVNFLNTYSRFSGTATPVFSQNVQVNYRKWGIPFINKVKSILIDGKEAPELIMLATNSFLFDYLDLISHKTFGLIKIEPLDVRGNPIEKPKVHGSEIGYLLKSFQ